MLEFIRNFLASLSQNGSQNKKGDRELEEMDHLPNSYHAYSIVEPDILSVPMAVEDDVQSFRIDYESGDSQANEAGYDIIDFKKKVRIF